MPSDIKIHDGSDGNWVTVEATVMNVKGSDIILDSPARRTAAGGNFRRAIVHDQSDGLTINFNNDYPGGVRVNGLQLNLRVLDQGGGAPKLPKEGNVGDLVAVRQTSTVGPGEIAEVIGSSVTLWLCVGGLHAFSGTSWRQLPLGESVIGSL
ncbi:MAG: hypothetical protein R3D28_11575 [Geminicoccaceae bacterium]|jgi:hypothetical protein